MLSMLLPNAWSSGSVLISFTHHQADTYGVSSNVNALLLAILDQIITGKDRVALNLVGSRDDTGGLNKSIEL